MEIKCLTNAGAWLKFKDTNILIDPWINDGKLGGALHTLPPLEVADIEILKSQFFDAVFVSHAHEDHFDLEFLIDFKKNFSKVLIGQIDDPTLKNILSRFEIPFLECACNEYTSVGDFSLAVIPPFRPSSAQEANKLDAGVDTSLVVRAGDARVFFAIDNPMTEADAATMHETYGPFDIAFLPYTGASHYPSTYASLSNTEKKNEINRIRQMKLERFCQLASEMKTSTFVPFAGSFITNTRHGGVDFQVSTPLAWFRENLDQVNEEIGRQTQILTKWDTAVIKSDRGLDFSFTDNHSQYLSKRYLDQRLHAIYKQNTDVVSETAEDILKSELTDRIAACNAKGVSRIKEANLAIKTNIYLSTDINEERVNFKLGSADLEEILSLDDLIEPYYLAYFNLQDLINFVHGRDYWKSPEYKTLNYRSPNVFDPVISQFFSRFKPS